MNSESHPLLDVSLRRLYRGVLRRLQRQQPTETVTDISDDYINWLCFANAGMLHRGNLLCFDCAIRNLPSADPIIEIGSFCGLSTNLLTYFKQKHGVRNPLITSDKWQFEGAGDGTIGASSIRHSEYRDFVRRSYIQNISMFSQYDLPYTIEEGSDEFFQLWRRGDEVEDVLGRSIRLGGPISFCYIDGNHSYEYAKRDFENCDEFLLSGGFVLFDDSAADSGWEVCDLVKEIEAGPAYQVVMKNPNYLFVKK